MGKPVDSSIKPYITGKYYGLFHDGKLIGDSADIFGILIHADNYYRFNLREFETILIADYIPEEMASETTKEFIKLCRMCNQIDESLCTRENMPMEITWKMVQRKSNYKYYL